MTRNNTGVIPLLLFVLLWTQWNAHAQQAAEPRGFTLQQRIVDSSNGKGLSGVKVKVGDSVATTNAEGEFTIKGLAVGRFPFSIERDGYVATSRIPATFEVEIGGKMRPMVLRMAKAVSLSGDVVDGGDQPVRDVRVELVEVAWEYGTRILIPFEYLKSNVKTNEKGTFAFTGVPPGTYLLRVRPNTKARVLGVQPPGPIEEALPTFRDTFYPNSPDVDGALKIVVRNVDVPGLRVKLRPAEFFSIRGTLRQVPKEPITVKLVAAVSNGSLLAELEPLTLESRSLSTSVDEDGAFALDNVLPGNYVAQASWFDTKARKRNFLGATAVEVRDRDIERLFVDVLPTSLFRGQIKYQDGRPFDRTIPVSLDYYSPIAGHGTHILKTSTDGTFEVANAVAGMYRLLLAGVSDSTFVVETRAFISSVEVDNKKLEGSIFEFTPGAGDKVVFQVGMQGGVIRGATEDTERVKFGGVAASMRMPLGPLSSSMVKLVTMERDGSFLFEGVESGTYRVCVLPDDRSLTAQLFDPARQELLARDCPNVHVVIGESEQVRVKRILPEF